MSPYLPRPSAALALLAAAPVIALASGCGSGGPADDRSTSDASITIVASTDVWGAVARAVGGDAVQVTSVIDDPSADPHSYESTPSDAAEVGGADLVVVNGGGYDEFMTDILGSGDATAPTVEAFALAESGDAGESGAAEHEADGEHQGEGEHGHSHEHGENEHVWYDLHVVEAVAQSVAERLGEIDPARAQTYTDNAATFADGVAGLQDQVSELAEQYPGTKVVSTEPVAFYLLREAGLDDVTPAEFVQAVEEETDPPAAAIAATDAAVTGGQVRVLVVNPQTETPVTQRVREQAEGAGVAIVDMTETMPDGADDYLAWMGGQIDALSDALGAAPRG